MDDSGIGRNIGRRGNHFRQRSQIGGPSHLIELILFG